MSQEQHSRSDVKTDQTIAAFKRGAAAAWRDGPRLAHLMEAPEDRQAWLAGYDMVTLCGAPGAS